MKAARRSLGTRVFLWSCVAMVCAFLSWAAIGRLDVVSLAVGEVVPSTKVKSVQHLEGGIVSEILVREGDRVKEGQPLVVLEPTKSGADVDELKVRLDSLAVDMVRLEAEAEGKPQPDFPPSTQRHLISQARAQFEARHRRLEDQIRVQREALSQREQEIKEVRARLRNNSTRITLVEEQIGISQKLLNLDLTNRMRHLELLKEASDLRGRVEEDRELLPRMEAALNEASARLAAITSVFQEEARKELVEATRSHQELSQRQRKLEDSLRRTVLRAPVDGEVKTLLVTTQGGVIRAGETVLDIVPIDDRLVIEARLPTQDIGFVRAGQMAQVRLSSAEAARFGRLEGKVIQVSPDTLLTQEGRPYYKVRIQTSHDHFQRGSLRYDLFPGMQVQCSIQTGSRTVLEYLLDPYISSLDTAMGER